MGQQSEDVRSQLTYQSARRSMATARKASIPSSPATIEEVIEGFNKNMYPPLYQDMFLGSVSHHISGNNKLISSKTSTISFTIHIILDN